MGLLLLVLALALAVAAFRLPPDRCLLLLVAVVVLVPGSLPLPHLPGVLTVHRLVMAAALAGVVRRCVRGELPWELLRPPPLLLRFLMVIGLIAVVGVGLLLPPTDAAAAARSWQALAVQLPFLLVWLVLLRAADGPLAGAVPLVVVSVVAAGIALVEAASGVSYARLWFHAVPGLLATDQAQQLATRGGHVRVRAASDFTLAFAWTSAAVVPLLLVVASLRPRLRRLLLVVGFPVLGLAVLLTYSRTVVLPLVVAVVVLAAVLRERAPRVAAGALLLGVLAALAFSPGLGRQFTAAVDTGSIDVRVERLPVVGALAAGHPWTGLGLSGLAARGIPATDSSYLLDYAEVGVLGLAALAALLLASVAACLGGVRARLREERLVSVAAATGLVLLLAGTFTFDTFSVPAAAETFWLLTALGLVAQDGLAPVRRSLGLPARAAAVGAALLVGVLLRAAAPSHVARTWQYEVLAPYPATVAAATYTGSELRSTFCKVARQSLEPVTMTCQPIGDAPGQGLLRLQAASAQRLHEDTARLLTATGQVRQLEAVRLLSRGPEQRGTPTGLRTAPGWLPLAVAVLVVPLPGRRRRA